MNYDDAINVRRTYRAQCAPKLNYRLKLCFRATRRMKSEKPHQTSKSITSTININLANKKKKKELRRFWFEIRVEIDREK